MKHEGGWSVDIKNKIEIEANKHCEWRCGQNFIFEEKELFRFFMHTKNSLLDDLESVYLIFLIFYFFSRRKRIIFYNKISGLINSYL